MPASFAGHGRWIILLREKTAREQDDQHERLKWASDIDHVVPAGTQFLDAARACYSQHERLTIAVAYFSSVVGCTKIEPRPGENLAKESAPPSGQPPGHPD